MKILVIIPAYNESLNIIRTVNSLKDAKLEEKYTLDYVIVNDGSVDNTKEICRENNFNVINLPVNLGIGGAVQTGYKYAYYNHYDVAIQYDGDGQHDATYIKDLIKEIEVGYDIVIGSRFVKELSEFKSTFIRRCGINFLSFLIRLLAGKKIYDPTSGFRACNTKVIEEFAKDYPTDFPEPDSITKIIKKGYHVSEIPVKMKPRTDGVSSLTTNIFKPAYYMIKVSVAIIIAGVTTRKVGAKNE